nr:MAG TPA: hypothetical protein [Bacteriophage sp.]
MVQAEPPIDGPDRKEGEINCLFLQNILTVSRTRGRSSRWQPLKRCMLVQHWPLKPESWTLPPVLRCQLISVWRKSQPQRTDRWSMSFGYRQTRFMRRSWQRHLLRLRPAQNTRWMHSVRRLRPPVRTA